MNNQFFRLPGGKLSPQAQNAYRVLLAFIAVQFLIMGFLVFQTTQTPSWQLWVMDGLGVGLMTFEILGLVQVRRGRHELGIWLAFMAFLIVLFAIPLLYSGLGIVFMVSALTITILVGGQTLPPRQLRLFILIGIIVGAADLLLDLFIPFQRTALPGFQNIVYLALAFLLPVLGYTIVRQFRDYSLRVKMIAAFVVIAVGSAGTISFLAQLSLRTSLTEEIANKLASQANSRGIEIATSISRDMDLLKTLSMNVNIQNAARMANQTQLSQADINRLDQQWIAADAANNNANPLVSGVLNNEISTQLRDFRTQFRQHVEVFLTGKQGVSIASTNRTSDYNQADEEWWQAAYRDSLYIGPPEYDASSKTLAMNMAVAVRENGNGPIIGVLRTTVNFTNVANMLKVGTFGQTGRTIILLPSDQEIRLNAVGDGSFALILEETSPELLALSQSAFGFQNVSLNGTPTLVSIASVIPVSEPAYDTRMVSKLAWQAVTLQDEAEALQSVTTQTRNIVLLTIAIVIAASIAALGMTQAFAGPISRLNASAEKVRAGDLTAQAKVETRDEIGTLAATFNSMTQRLRDFISTLESRVAERTQSLELAAEVGRTVSQVRALDVMLKEAAELIRSRFDLYYVQVYLTNPSQTALVLQSGTGTVGAELVARAHQLPLNTASLNGRAAIEKHSVVISDTAASAAFRPNPLLPDTRSEMAVPLLIGDKVVGVLDMQSEHAGSLSQDVLPAFEALAGQLAIAIQNATFLAETQQARAEVEVQARRLVRTNWKDYLDAIHKPEQTGFVFEQNKVVPLSEAGSLQPPAEGSAISAPIAVTGEPLGTLVVEMDAQNQSAQNVELVNAVARQVAQQIESLRLLDSAERYRFEAEESSRRLTREGWKNYMDVNADQGSSYIYDLKEVRPYNQARDPQTEETSLSLPLKVRDETVGKLVVQGLGSDDKESLELSNAVAERLGAHIESLRQFDQTQSALAQSEKLSVASMRFAQSADLQELLTVANETFDIPVVNRMLLGVFNYDSANELESMDIAANWWNGSGHEPSEIGRHYSIETLNVLPLFMSATPVFSDDTFHDERVNGAALELVTQQNIRSMAVLPLYLGGRQVGVLFLESEETHNFTQSDTRLFTAVAPQIATVLENRRQFERAQQQAERETTLNLISQKIQSATTVEAVLQIAARELGHALGAPMTIAQLSMKDKK
jgi:GAF domain-containing protein/HAMP domain-containing protein